MNKAMTLYEDCVAFWMRMGVKKEDNIMALSMYDVIHAKPEGWEGYDISYYTERAKELHKILCREEYNENRGKNGWLNDKGL